MKFLQYIKDRFLKTFIHIDIDLLNRDSTNSR